mmetsp:Transcript_9874/g.36808  ORF Transcript_9874/g.36808 Transcript_9874/m.36808 type:complete len:490 (-) Transcript_9874:47-1516(-)
MFSSKLFSSKGGKILLGACTASAAAFPLYNHFSKINSQNGYPSSYVAPPPTNSSIHADARLPPSLPKLSSSEIHAIISQKENTIEIMSQDCIVEKLWMSQYAANKPIEDYYFVEDLDKRSLFLAVLDGHGGTGCAQWISKNMTPVWKRGIYEMTERVKEVEAYYQVDDIKRNVDKIEVSKEKREDLKKSLDNKLMYPELLKMSFAFLDQMFFDRAVDSRDIEKAIPGSCAVAAYALDDELYVANLGDCRAVLGRKHWWTGKWEAVPLTKDQTAISERESLQKEHPNDPNVVSEGRIKGILQPSRSFGDVILKVPGLLAAKYVSLYAPWEPPYVTPIPEVTQFNLKPNKGDRFIIFATDGLWDALSSDEAVQLVGAHLDSSSNDNVCTSLIRKALCQNTLQQQMNPPLSDEDSLSVVLTCPEDMRRNLHDDITVTVAVLRQDYKLSPQNKDQLPDAERVHYPVEIEDLMRKSKAHAMKIQRASNATKADV